MRLIAFLTALLFIAPASHAQSPQYKSGLNHTRVHISPDLKEKAAEKFESTKVEKPAKPSVKKPSENSETSEEDAATRVWEKYKKLARGEAEETPSENAPKKPKVEKPESPKAQKQTKADPPGRGFAKILESFARNKESRKDMRTLNFAKPEPAK